jgi:hypothetical protein
MLVEQDAARADSNEAFVFATLVAIWWWGRAGDTGGGRGNQQAAGRAGRRGSKESMLW